MASIQKTPRGYRAQVKKLGVRDSRLFTRRGDAVTWGAQRELEIVMQASTPLPDQHTLRQALRRFADEVSPKRKGERWERVRLSAFEFYQLPLDIPLSKVTTQHLATFRDSRGAVVGPGSVRREMSLLSSVLEVARTEWGWIKTNPCQAIRWPAAPPHRRRTIRTHEMRSMLRSMSFKGPPRNLTQAVAVCFLVALATGMRAGELCNLTWDQVFDVHVYLPETKNGTAREVPLSYRARRYISMMRGFHDTLVFGLTTGQLDALFRKHRYRQGLSGFTFHDSRHTAATMMARRMDVLTLCEVMGWSDPKMAMIYYNPDVSVIAAMLG